MSTAISRDEHARALGMMRPQPLPQGLLGDGDERPRARNRRPLGRRESVVRPGGTEFISFGSKSRLPNQMSRDPARSLSQARAPHRA